MYGQTPTTSTNQDVQIIIKLNKSYITHTKKCENWNFSDYVVLILLFILIAYTGEWGEI